MKYTEIKRGSHPLGLSRRDAITTLFPAFVTYALLAEAHAGTPVTAGRWIDRQEEIARALTAGQMRPSAWQSEVEALAREVDLVELMALVSGSRVTPAPQGASNDPKKRYVRFLDEAGEPRRLSYGAAFFDFAPRNVITPHCHTHMVSAHLIVQGAFRVRNFDRLRDEEDAIVIQPTRDYVAHVGELSTMSSERDNIHWFVPQGGPARTFDVVVSGIDQGQEDYEIRAIDPLGGQALENGAILAPFMSFASASARYTADV